MINHDALIEAFGDYARTLSVGYDMVDVLYRLIDQVVEVLAVDAASVFVADRIGRLQFVAGTAKPVIQLEERPIGSPESPAHDAFNEQEQVVCDALEAERRWPEYRNRALDNGVRAVVSIPMTAADERIGALVLYLFSPTRWETKELGVAQVMAQMSTGYIVNARAMSEIQRLAAQLQHALDSRIVIEQAKGVLAGRHGSDLATAWAELRGIARSRREKIHDTARDVIEGRLSG